MKNFIYGIIIGLAFIIPGVSGGTLAVMLGIYDKMINSITSFFKDKKNNAIFILTLGAGIVIGILLFSKLLNYLLTYYEYPVKYAFMGLIIGGVPALYQSIKKEKDTKIDFRITVIAILLCVGLFCIEKYFVNYSIEENIIMGNIPYLGLIIAGFLYASGKIVPGISGTALLMLIGMYDYLIDMVANVTNITMNQLMILVPFGISFIVSAIILFIIINYLIKKHYSKTYSAIFGFVLGSLIYVFPGFGNDKLLLSLVLFVLSTILTVYLSNKKVIE